MKNSICKFLTSLLLLILPFSFTSCDDLTKTGSGTLKNYFQEYTEEAWIGEHEYPTEYPVDKNGFTCIPSDSDITLVFYLANPQGYSMNKTYVAKDGREYLGLSFSLSAKDAAAKRNFSDWYIDQNGITLTPEQITNGYDYSSNGYKFAQEFKDDDGNEDTAKCSVAISADFLKYFDQGYSVSSSPDFSPTIGIIGTGNRQFKNYQFDVKVNSVPPTVKDAVVMVQNDNGTEKYVLCFNLPGYGIITNRHEDLQKLIINDQEFEITIDKNKNISFTNKDLISDSADGLNSPAGVDALSFDHVDSSNKKSFYYKTGIEITEEDNFFEVTLEDRDGLSSQVNTHVQTEKLTPPTLYSVLPDKIGAEILPDGKICKIAQESNGCGKIYMEFSTKTVSKAEVEDTKINYEIYDYDKTDGIYKSIASKSGSIKKGDNQIIEVSSDGAKIVMSASKSLYVDSDPVTFLVKPVVNTVYVSENGDDNNDGTKAYPVKTLACALTKLEGVSDATANNTIYLLSDLTTGLVTSEQIAITICSYDSDAPKTISGNTESSSIISVENKDSILILKDVNISCTNNELSQNYAISTNAKTNKFTNVKINVTNANGINVTRTNSACKFDLDNVEITSGSGNGTAVFANNSNADFTFDNKVVIKGFEKNFVRYTDKGNVNSITLAENFSAESEIHVYLNGNHAPTPGNPITIAQGFILNKKISQIFYCDNGYNVTLDQEGTNVQVAIGGGNTTIVGVSSSAEFVDNVSSITRGGILKIKAQVIYDYGLDENDEPVTKQVAPKEFISAQILNFSKADNNNYVTSTMNDGTITATVSNLVLPGNYVLCVVFADEYGTNYSHNMPFTIKEGE